MARELEGVGILAFRPTCKSRDPRVRLMWKDKRTRTNNAFPDSRAHGGANGGSGWVVVNRGTAGEGAPMR